MYLRLLAAMIISLILITGCVTKVINSDGSVQSTTVDNKKLSETYVDLAIEYQGHDAPQVALERVNLAISTNPKNPRAYMVRAMIYEAIGKANLAEDDFKEALDLNNKYSEAYVNYAVFLCKQKRYKEAENKFMIALDNPLYVTPEVGYYNRGNCFYQENKIESARMDYLKALTFRNAPQDTYIMLANLEYSAGNAQIAYDYINKFTGTQTPATLLLQIKILDALIHSEVNKAKLEEYTNNRKTLLNFLIKYYGNIPEVRQYTNPAQKNIN